MSRTSPRNYVRSTRHRHFTQSVKSWFQSKLSKNHQKLFILRGELSSNIHFNFLRLWYGSFSFLNQRIFNIRWSYTLLFQFHRCTLWRKALLRHSWTLNLHVSYSVLSGMGQSHLLAWRNQLISHLKPQFHIRQVYHRNLINGEIDENVSPKLSGFWTDIFHRNFTLLIEGLV